jgi:inner membrane protein involved in colicin E2 resistance
MKKNVGSLDKVIRYLLAIGLTVVSFTVYKVQDGNKIGYALLGLALVFVVTSLISWCPIWAALNIKTKKS